MGVALAYGKQETIEPLKGLGHFVGFGLAAAVVGATGILMLTLGTMRVLQTQTGGSLGGNWNWVPYVAGLVVLGDPDRARRQQDQPEGGTRES